MVRPHSTDPVLDFVVRLLGANEKRPLVIGLSGPQGSGKSSVVKAVAELLRSPPHGLNVVEFSLDDVYLTHDEQVKLASSGNSLLQQRGLPGTHDVGLCMSVISALKRQQKTAVPQYDKSAFQGQGDRAPQAEFVEALPPVDVVLLEGWCVGFKQLPEEVVRAKWNASDGTLKEHSLADVLEVNRRLGEYTQIWDEFDALVHLDAEDIGYVYDWRLEQEHKMIALKGSGMSDAGVRKFVDGYMPAYELYNDALRQSVDTKMLRVGLRKDRTCTVKDSKM
ncbi:probable ATP-dependent kinase Tda10p [Trichomonascus vanleenenianus]|uniref:putative ATP-dependent kinase n=1 Tax=Trichomonascus vanleenenianus TaxID=2268995 RepID=UPI003ECBAE39